MDKDEQSGLRLKKNQKQIFKREAEARGFSLSGLFVFGAQFLIGFGRETMNRLQDFSDATRFDPGTIGQCLLQSLLAKEAAFQRVFGYSNVMRDAFQFDSNNRLIVGDALFQKVQEDHFKKLSELKRQMQADKADGKQTVVSAEALNILQAAL